METGNGAEVVGWTPGLSRGLNGSPNEEDREGGGTDG